MNLLYRIDEEIIKSKSKLVGHEEELKKCLKILDVIHNNENENNIDFFNEIDIRSINIFYGETGTGKTTLAYSIASVALEEYGIESYSFNIENIIKTELGATVKNFESAFAEIRKLSEEEKGIILFLDEFDRLLVNRGNDNEVSELKRALIALMDFFQSISIKQKITILATTNHFESLDSAFKRRFSFKYEIKSNEESRREYFNKLKNLIPQSFEYSLNDEIIEGSSSIAEMKKKVREDIIKLIN